MRTFPALFILSVITLSCAAPVEEESVVRERRFVSRVENPPKRQESHVSGSVDGGISRDRRIGTMVHGRADGVWTSKDGNTRVGAGVSYGRVHDGPAAGPASKGGYINVQHSFPGK
ncbi:uncharacterized protein LOC126162167 [Schistocerca cancellata]|uniref:uncharacterized protein LOC126162167 n=1 Tax=Schistocerca cancellata TaxID=274614 RepID=UPI002118364C|nr:uncharacterized protein LOC126162167 [Schistocerca cancellata]